MAIYVSGDEVCDRLRTLISDLTSALQERTAIERQCQDMMEQGYTASEIQTAINARLTIWASRISDITDQLGDIPSVWRPEVRIGMPARLNSVKIEANSQSNTNDLGEACGAIHINGISAVEINPFSVFAAGDIVSIIRAEDSSNKISAKVQWTPETAGAEVIINGAFASSSNWTEANDGGTEVTITGGQAVFSSADCVLKQLKADMVGGGWTSTHRYLVRFTLSDVASGTLSVGTNTSAAQHVVTANGEHYAIILSDNNAAGLVFTASGGFTGKLDSVSCVPFNGLAINQPLGQDNDEDTKLVVVLAER